MELVMVAMTAMRALQTGCRAGNWATKDGKMELIEKS